MACKVPHTVEQLQKYVQKQTEKGDTDRQKAIVEVIKQFELAKAQTKTNDKIPRVQWYLGR